MIYHSSLPLLTFNALIFILSRSITLSHLAQLKKLERTVEQLLEAVFFWQSAVLTKTDLQQRRRPTKQRLDASRQIGRQNCFFGRNECPTMPLRELYRCILKNMGHTKAIMAVQAALHCKLLKDGGPNFNRRQK